MSTEYKEEELRRAARDGRIDDVRKYLNDNTVDVNEEDKWGCIALPLACRNGIVMLQSFYWIKEPISMQRVNGTV